MSDFENLNNAFVRAASRGGAYGALNNDFQKNVTGERMWMEAIPPMWAASLEKYWVQYAKLYVADANKTSLTDPASIVPGGITQAVKDLYAPTIDTAGKVVAASKAAVNAKLQALHDAVNAKLQAVGTEIGKGIQTSTTDWVWGLSGLAVGAGLLWLLLRGKGGALAGVGEGQPPYKSWKKKLSEVSDRELVQRWRDMRDFAKHSDPDYVQTHYGRVDVNWEAVRDVEAEMRRRGVKKPSRGRGLSGLGREHNILYETTNLYLYKTSKGLEIRLNGPTHAVLVGSPKDVESAKRAMSRMERHPGNLRAFLKG